jgi:uncharacterized membrane protein
VDRIVIGLEKLTAIVPCHRKKDRSVSIYGRSLPLCARCTGILIGYLLFPFLLIFMLNLPIWLGILLNIPMAADGWTQKMHFRESNNTLRMTTGILCGCGQSILIVSISHWIITLIS